MKKGRRRFRSVRTPRWFTVSHPETKAWTKQKEPSDFCTFVHMTCVWYFIPMAMNLTLSYDMVLEEAWPSGGPIPTGANLFLLPVHFLTDNTREDIPLFYEDAIVPWEIVNIHPWNVNALKRSLRQYFKRSCKSEAGQKAALLLPLPSLNHWTVNDLKWRSCEGTPESYLLGRLTTCNTVPPRGEEAAWAHIGLLLLLKSWGDPFVQHMRWWVMLARSHSTWFWDSNHRKYLVRFSLIADIIIVFDKLKSVNKNSKKLNIMCP